MSVLSKKSDAIQAFAVNIVFSTILGYIQLQIPRLTRHQGIEKSINVNTNILQELIALFPPGPRFIHKSVIPHGADDGRAAAERIFYGRTWAQLDLLEVKGLHPGPVSELPAMMNARAFVHFLPAFIGWIDIHPGKTDSLHESLLHYFFRDAQGEKSLAGLFTAPQRAFLRAYFTVNYHRTKASKNEYQVVDAYLSAPSPACND